MNRWCYVWTWWISKVQVPEQEATWSQRVSDGFQQRSLISTDWYSVTRRPKLFPAHRNRSFLFWFYSLYAYCLFMPLFCGFRSFVLILITVLLLSFHTIVSVVSGFFIYCCWNVRLWVPCSLFRIPSSYCFLNLNTPFVRIFIHYLLINSCHWFHVDEWGEKESMILHDPFTDVPSQHAKWTKVTSDL